MPARQNIERGNRRAGTARIIFNREGLHRLIFFVTFFARKKFSKRKNGKKESTEEAADIQAKGNGINAGVTAAEKLIKLVQEMQKKICTDVLCRKLLLMKDSKSWDLGEGESAAIFACFFAV
jgi:hypothetical protein